MYIKTVTVDLRMFESSGIGTYLQNIVPVILKKMTNYKFYLLGEKSTLLKFKLDSFETVEFIQFNCPIYSIKEQFLYIKKIPKSTDLLWIPHYNIPIFYSGKLLTTVHDLFPFKKFSVNKSLLKKLYASIFFKTIAIKAKKIITVSYFTANEYESYFGNTVKQKIKVISNGVSDDWRNIVSQSESALKPYIVYVGNVKPHKNLISLLNAFNLIKDDIEYDLVIVGKKEGFITGDQSVIELAKSMGERIHFTGFVENWELKQYVKNAALMVYPSLYEGFGLPPLEAMAAGCPVIVSRIASLPEVCEEASLYFDPFSPEDIAEKIIKVVNDNSLRSDLVKRGFKQSKKYSWQTTAFETIRLIEECLEVESSDYS
jgi:glycosyltransferase involved in cell wall biosynthesis